VSELHTEKRTRLHLLVRDRILNMVIRSGSRRGDPLPSYRDLTERFGVSLVTVQRAMDELIKDGVVCGWPGRGTFLDRDLTPGGRKLTQIGIVMNCERKTFFSSAYLMEIFQGVMLQCEELNIDVRLFSIKSDGTLSPRQISASGIDGVLLLGVSNEEYIAEVVRELSPVIVVDHSGTAATDFVVSDSSAALQSLVAHLTELGHRRIAYAAGWTTDSIAGLQGRDPNIESPISLKRSTAFLDAMKAAGLRESATIFSVPSDPYQSNEAHVQAWKVATPRPTAIIANGAGQAAGLIAEFERSGVSVPTDVSIAAAAGTGNEAIAGRLVLTYHRVHFIEMGRKAVSLLNERCGALRPEKEHVWPIGSELIAGTSTGRVTNGA
jgi:DNA-binding LacI/PurR family transcriptional regulator